MRPTLTWVVSLVVAFGLAFLLFREIGAAGPGDPGSVDAALSQPEAIQRAAQPDGLNRSPVRPESPLRILAIAKEGGFALTDAAAYVWP